MAAAELTLDATTVKTMSGDGIYDYLDVNGSPNIEVVRVRSSTNGDWFYSKKFSKIIGVLAQNHGATFATGVSVDPPRIVVNYANDTAKITINHTNTAEFFTIALFGEL